MKTKQADRGALRFLGGTAGKTKWMVAILALVQITLGAVSIGFAFFLRNLVNAAVIGNRETFFTALAELTALICAQLLLRAVNRCLDERVRSTLESLFKRRLFATLLAKDFAAVSAVHSGEWMNRLTNDTVVVSKGITEIIPGAAGTLVKLAGAVAAIVALEPRFCFLLVPGGMILIVLSSAFRKTIKRLHKAVQERDGGVRVFLTETLSGLIVVRAFGVEAYIERECDKKMKAYQAARMRKSNCSNACNMGIGIVMKSAYVLGAAFCGYAILMGRMSYGSFVAVLELINQAQTPFASISGYLPRYYAVLASAERLMEAENLPPAPCREPRSLEQVRQSYANDFVALGLSHISFSYPPPARKAEEAVPAREKRLVLRDISLSVHKGACIAFTGPSGCGKSTVLKLLLCLYPADFGERYLDLTSGRRPLTEEWQRMFAYVPQGNHLMSGTIREIVALGDHAAAGDDARLWQALAIACADGFVKELAQGADTLIGERGLGLSEGQVQRLAVARAVFTGHPILMLDECTSALDAATEKKMLQNLRAMTDKTVLIVTHRSAAWEMCDEVIRFSESGYVVPAASCRG